MFIIQESKKDEAQCDESFHSHFDIKNAQNKQMQKLESIEAKCASLIKTNDKQRKYSQQVVLENLELKERVINLSTENAQLKNELEQARELIRLFKEQGHDNSKSPFQMLKVEKDPPNVATMLELNNQLKPR